MYILWHIRGGKTRIFGSPGVWTPPALAYKILKHEFFKYIIIAFAYVRYDRYICFDYSKLLNFSDVAETITEADLRIGNYYFFANKMFRMDLKMMYAFCRIQSYAIEMLTGVPLLPSMLTMAGFKEEPKGIFLHTLGLLEIRYWSNDSIVPDGITASLIGYEGVRRIGVPDTKTGIKRIKYLHELQSLYYAINTQELTLEF